LPIRIPDGLPAIKTLTAEGVPLLTARDADRQDIRPLQIGMLNLMPKKVQTETQIARLLGSTPLQIEMTLVRVSGHRSKNTSKEHLISFYETFDEVADRKFDGFIITGAPIEHLAFEDVDYWDELTRILDWTTRNVHSSFFVCWGAMAAAYHFHGVPKHMLSQKAFGVYRHRNLKPSSPYLQGFSDDFQIPVSRWTELKRGDIDRVDSLEMLMESDVTGPCLFHEDIGNRLYILNHIEYDSGTLKEEYDRDVSIGAQVSVPHNYYPADDPTLLPQNRWRSHAYLLFSNWINRTYQTTPFDLDAIGRRST